MTKEEWETKIQALLTLMEFSLLLTVDDKEYVKNNIEKFTDEEIQGLGTILAIEHRDRSKLDEVTIDAFFESIRKNTKTE